MLYTNVVSLQFRINSAGYIDAVEVPPSLLFPTAIFTDDPRQSKETGKHREGRAVQIARKRCTMKGGLPMAE